MGKTIMMRILTRKKNTLNKIVNTEFEIKLSSNNNFNNLIK
jgi:hypothetical protein